MKRNELVKTIILISSIIVSTVVLSVLLNLITGKKIASDAAKREELAAQQAAGELLEVLPVATGFEDITSTLVLDEAGLVVSVYKEVSGNGYAFIAESTFGDMVNNAKVTVGVDSEGKIAGVLVNIIAPDFGGDKIKPTYDSLVGQDSTLAGFVNSAGATHSSTAIKNAISAGFSVLSSNKLMEAAKKSTEQLFEENIATLYVDYVKKGETLVAEGNIYEAYTSYNGSLVVCYVNSGNDKLLVLSNASGVVKVYKMTIVDEEKQTPQFDDVTSANSAVVEEVQAYIATQNISKYSALVTKLETMFAGATDFNSIEVTLFNDCVAAASFTYEGATYYGFYTRPCNSFDNSAMDIYVVLDSEGKIAKVSIAEFFVNQHGFEYIVPSIGTFDKQGYLDKFNGVSSDLINNESFEKDGAYHISGATKTTDGIKAGLNSAIAVYNTLQGGNE